MYFDKLYDKFTDLEKKEFLNSFLEQVDIYEQEEQPDGRFLKHSSVFPVYFGDRRRRNFVGTTKVPFETVVLLFNGEVDSEKDSVEFSLEDMDMSNFRMGQPSQIKEYVLEHTRLKVSNLYISQIKRKCGIGVGKNYNLPKSEDSRQPQCLPEKEKAIREAFKYFGMI